MMGLNPGEGFSFLEINDGSCMSSLQIIADNDLSNYEKDVTKLQTGCSIKVTGTLAPSQGKGQKVELQAKEIQVLGWSDPEVYPLQKKRHSFEFLRTIAHLRPRTNKYGAIFRIRSELSYAIHRFFKKKGFRYIHTPIITASDCEGAGELFKVTTLPLDNLPLADGKPDYQHDFFSKEAGLTVSGQLSAEMFALSLGDVYTFGPTFRAENSNTSRHVAEFWMVEPEMAFCNLAGNMDLGEEMIQNLCGYVLDNCKDDIELFARFVDKTLLETLETIVAQPFERIPYLDAVDILKRSNKTFDFEVEAGRDLQSEHERYLTEEYFQKPVIVYDYPKEIKAFYMRMNDDSKTVAAMDVLVPEVGEIIGGAQREERLDVLDTKLQEHGLSEDLWWYRDLRRYGTVPHAGFGLGFERVISYITGMTNIRDVIPYPRVPGRADF